MQPTVISPPKYSYLPCVCFDAANNSLYFWGNLYETDEVYHNYFQTLYTWLASEYPHILTPNVTPKFYIGLGHLNIEGFRLLPPLLEVLLQLQFELNWVVYPNDLDMEETIAELPPSITPKLNMIKQPIHSFFAQIAISILS